MSLVCESCKRDSSLLYGKVCPECNYVNQCTLVLKCDQCHKILGYYREFDIDVEPNYIDKAFCVNCRPEVRGSGGEES